MRLLPVFLTTLPFYCVRAAPARLTQRSNACFALPFTKTGYGRETNGGSNDPVATLNNNVQHYSIDVTVGSPPQAISVILDTGSSDIWFYAPGACVNCTDTFYEYTQSTTEVALPDLGQFHVSYGSSPQGVTGFYAADIVLVGGASVKQIIGVAEQAGDGTPPGGIFGIGLPQGESVFDTSGQSYPGYLDNLKSAGYINTRAYSIYLEDQTPTDSTPGTIIFGGQNPSKYTGDLMPFGLTEPAPDGEYRLDIDEPTLTVTLNGQQQAITASSPSYRVLLDTGSTLTSLPVDQVAALSEIVTFIDSGAGNGGTIYAVDCSLAENTGGIDFSFAGPMGSKTIHVPWQELVLPISGVTDECLFGIQSYDQSVAEGVYILGDTFLRSAYALFDFDASTISLAQASYDLSPGQIIEV